MSKHSYVKAISKIVFKKMANLDFHITTMNVNSRQILKFKSPELIFSLAVLRIEFVGMHINSNTFNLKIVEMNINLVISILKLSE